MTTSPLHGARIGYVPYTHDLSGPSDRRRFCHYAKLRGLTHEVPLPGEKYDVIMLASLADVTHWSRHPSDGTKIVYDLPDSYLDIDRSEWKARLRGPAKYLLRQHAHFEASYHDSLGRMCSRADAVVCSTPEQAKRIRSFNDAVHPILDFQVGAAKYVKTDFSIGDAVHFVWEGMAINVFTLGEVAPVLRRVAKRRRIALHLITDVEFKPFNGPTPKMSTRRVVERHLDGIPTYLYEWNESMFARIATSCDLALIPMSNGPIYRAKAENKLLLFWRMAVPTITQATPAYARTMAAADVPMTCEAADEWEDTIERYLADEDARREAAERGMRYAETEHGVPAVASRWDEMFRRALEG